MSRAPLGRGGQLVHDLTGQVEQIVVLLSPDVRRDPLDGDVCIRMGSRQALKGGPHVGEPVDAYMMGIIHGTLRLVGAPTLHDRKAVRTCGSGGCGQPDGLLPALVASRFEPVLLRFVIPHT